MVDNLLWQPHLYLPPYLGFSSELSVWEDGVNPSYIDGHLCCTDFVFHVKWTKFCFKRGLMVQLDLYAPDFSKSTSKYLFFTNYLESMHLSASTQCIIFKFNVFKKIFWAAQSFKLFQFYILKIFLTKIFLVVLEPKTLQNRLFCAKKEEKKYWYIKQKK